MIWKGFIDMDCFVQKYWDDTRAIIIISQNISEIFSLHPTKLNTNWHGYTAYHIKGCSNFLVESQYEISTIQLENFVVETMY